MDVSELLTSLNQDQRDAVTSDAKHLLVLAGAGSGKTRVLVHRIGWLLQVNALSASSILAVTFTNKAAKEMQLRISDLLNASPRGLWVGTFHGLAHRLLKMHWAEAGLPQNFQIIDSDDQLRIVKRLMKEQGIDETRFAPKSVQWYINGKKDEGLRPQHIDHNNDYHEKTLVSIYQSYQQTCERAGQVDFGEILLRSHELWLKNPALLEHYQKRFKHILVDEFQDTNAVQYAWLRMLAGGSAMANGDNNDGRGITIVGDDDQSIYGWRGAKIENIHNFQNDFSNVQLIKLEQNYRSTSNILQAANAVIANNPHRLGKNLWTDGLEGEKISLYAGFNEQDEARFIAERISHHFEENSAYKEQAILYRSNAQSRVLEEALIRSSIPYRIYGGQRFYDRLEIKNAIAYLRLSFFNDDDAAFERVINTPTRGIGAKTLERLRLVARERELSMWQAAKLSVSERLLPSKALSSFANFMQVIESITEQSEQLCLGDLAAFVLEASDLIAFHGKEAGEKGRARVENLQELVNAAKDFVPEEPEKVLSEFLDEVALDAGDQQVDAHADSVQLMTFHSAKGLEFPIVYIAGAEENLFPHKMSADDPVALEEERRICYVGITRAMSKLYMTHAECRRWYGQDAFNPVSRFVKEIPAECLEEVRINSSVTRPVAGWASGEEIEGIGLALGEPVFHKIFGEGVVLGVEGQGSNARVQVNFDSEGSKWLVAAYANLEKI